MSGFQSARGARVMGIALTGWLVSSLSAAVIYESASLGPIGQAGGPAVRATQFLGSRFEITQTTNVTAIGGHLRETGLGNQELFGAIVMLAGPGAMPGGAPFNPGEVMTSITFNPNPATTNASDDIMVPVSVQLEPGSYAVVFGSGLFGATGDGGMPFNGQTVTAAGSGSYFFWDGNFSTWLNGGGFGPLRFVVEGTTAIDTDNDGLTDAAELVLGTDPNNPDTDGDGMLDGVEVDAAAGDPCPDPLNADSDGDTLLDGDEITLGSSPCDSDTDGDGVPDSIDTDPVTPGDALQILEDVVRNVSDTIRAMNINPNNGEVLILGRSNRARRARRNILGHTASLAAFFIDVDLPFIATIPLQAILRRTDGEAPPRDWILDSPERDAINQDVQTVVDTLLSL